MEEFEKKLNDLLVGIFNTILDIEETAIKHIGEIDISMSEVHLIEKVGDARDGISIMHIAKELGITMPSVTVAIKKLLSKGYVTKVKCSTDARSIKVFLTTSGERVYANHKFFHMQMIKDISNDLTCKEKDVLLSGVGKINIFFKNKLEELG